MSEDGDGDGDVGCLVLGVQPIGGGGGGIFDREAGDEGGEEGRAGQDIRRGNVGIWGYRNVVGGIVGENAMDGIIA